MPNGGLYRLAKTSPYKGSTLLGPTAKAFCTADLRYSDPIGYLISSILSLPLPKDEGGSLGASQRTTTAKRLDSPPIRPELDTAKESPPIRKEEERPGFMGIPEVGPKPNQASPGKEGERHTGPRNRTNSTTSSKVLQNTKRNSEQMIRREAQTRREKLRILGEHTTNGQRMFSEDTERTRGNKRESRKVIIITGHLTATKP